MKREQPVKEKKERNQNQILKAVLICSTCLVAAVTGICGWMLYSSERQDREEAVLKEENVVLKEEAGAYLADREMAQRFLDTGKVASTGEDGDKKTPIRIVEVIPHEVCSVFPYMIEWGSEEAYDENTALGYDGLRYITSKYGQYAQYSQYGMFKEGIQREALDDYDVKLGTEGNWQDPTISWWRESKENEVITATGYFEYVGSKKGLYHINLDKLVSNDSQDKGIRYEIRAMERDGNASKKGEWEVNDPKYFWAKDYAGGQISYPTTDIGQITGYNYDVMFTAGSSGASYRVSNVKTALEGSVSGSSYDYAAVWKGNSEWKSGYTYLKKGNYKVSSYTAERVTESTDLNGKYIRVSNKSKNDGTGLEAGYFRLYSPSDPLPETVYDVKFTYASSGSYILTPSAVQRIVDDSNKTEETIQFEYIGSGMGNYDVVFMYAPENTSLSYEYFTYQPKILKVSNGNGRYAMTSGVAKEDQLYIKAGANQGDYSKVVTLIDCAGVDYTSYGGIWTSGYYDTDGNNASLLPGLIMGAGKYNHNDEHGDWVFHTVSSDDVNGFTKIEELEGGKVPSNKRIYVYSQKRINRYYAKSLVKSNEWFKLLIYLGNADGTEPLAYADYQSGMAPEKVKEKYASEIKEFDRSYKVEFIQKTPGELSVSDVDSADLIFFSNGVNLQGLSKEAWNEYAELDPERSLSKAPDSLEYTSDISAEVLLSIYKHCLYDQDTALMFGAWTNGGLGSYVQNGEAKKNLGKLVMLANLFEDPRAFAYFMDGYGEKNGAYSAVHSDASITVWKQPADEVYNLGQTALAWYGPNTQGAGLAIEPYTTDVWKMLYFRVVKLVEAEWGGLQIDPAYYKDGYINGEYGFRFSFSPASGWYDNKDVDDDRVWYIPGQTPDAFWNYGPMKNIWRILHNKGKKQKSEPVVIVTNADGDNIDDENALVPVYYFYVDDYSLSGVSREDFDVKYKINWTPENVTSPTALQSVVMTRSDGSVVQNIAGPSYQTEYTCNVATDFMKDGALNDAVTSKEYQITATDAAGHTDYAIVRFIVREAFMLN